MLAYLRVLAFYIGTAALLTWGLFALGLSDTFEMPGFEGPRSVTPTASAPSSSAPPQTVAAPSPPPVPDVGGKAAGAKTAAVVPAPSVGSGELAGRGQVAIVTKPLEQPAAPVATGSTPPQSQPVAAPPPPALPSSSAMPPAASVPVRQQPEAPKVATTNTAPVERRPSPAPPDVTRSAETAPLVTAPMRPAPVLPPQKPTGSPVVTPPAQAKVPVPPSRSQPKSTNQTWWEVQRRIAGYGLDGLIDQLETAKASQDDFPCVMLREIRFRPNSAQFDPKANDQVEILAKILAAFPERRVEIGSQLGPGRPMATDGALRAGRVSTLRDALVTLGVRGDRLLVEVDGTFERVGEDVRRLGLARTQSMGVCLRE